MKKIFYVVAAAFLLGVLAQAEVLTVAAFNVQNYLVTDRMVEGVYKLKYPKPEKEKAAVVEVIKAANPDVLVVCEMGEKAFFEEFKSRLKQSGLDYPYTALTRGTDTQRYLAILSRKKFELTHYGRLGFEYEGKRELSLRGLLEARFPLPEGKSWRLFGVHLKSRYSENQADPDAEDFRNDEARAVREQILKVAPPEEVPYLVVGDFNDSPKSPTVRKFMKKGRRGLTEMLQPVDSRGEVWTHYWKKHGSYSRIDYILASPAMLPAVVEESAGIVDVPAAKIASDHRMVFIKIDTARLGGLEAAK